MFTRMHHYKDDLKTLVSWYKNLITENIDGIEKTELCSIHMMPKTWYVMAYNSRCKNWNKQFNFRLFLLYLL